MRKSKSENYVALENNGLVSTTLKFNISDSKGSNVKTKGRQSSSLYKVQCSNFQEVLNAHLDGGFKSPVDGKVICELTNITQVFNCSVDGLRVTVGITEEELGGDFNLDNNGYTKKVLYKILQEAQEVAKQLDPSDPRYQNAVDSKIRGRVLSANGLEEPSSYQGLYLLEPESSLFGPPAGTSFSMNTKSPSGFFPEDLNKKGRIKPLKAPVVNPSPAFAQKNIYFNSFTSLPVSLTLVERDYEPAPFPSFVVPATDLSLLIIDSLTTVGPGGLTTSKNGIQHTVIIESRFTSYEIQNPDKLNNKNNEVPITYTYFEDGICYERAFVQGDFLGACLHRTLYQYIAQLHSKRISYLSLKIDSYEQKNWLGDGSYCKKNPLSKFDTKEFPFRISTTGQHTMDIVNNSTNLLFTAEFDNNTGNFYKSNRFVTCSAFATQSQVVDIQYQDLFLALEKAFGEEIVLSDFPYVSLVPAFERGTIVQITNTLYFRGLVSNASAPSSMFLDE
jgi:hypothetical protein